jgi:hypothetical protein
MRAVAMVVLPLALAGCATQGPQPAPERLVFVGKLDLSRPGIGLLLSHESGLACQGHYGAGRLPETLALLVTCNDEQTGTLSLAKTDELRGAVVLSGGKAGDVTFERAAAPPLPALVPPTVPAAPPPAVAAPATVQPPPPPSVGPSYRVPRVTRRSTGYVRAHTRRGTTVRGHYRAGRYVRPHYRSGTTVRAHYRKKRR